VSGAVEPYARLAALGLVLPPAARPIGLYTPAVIAGGFLYLSGQGPREADGRMHTGKVGRDVGTEVAAAYARLVALNLLSAAHEALGDLRRVVRVVKLLGMVNAVPDFADHVAVINGASALLLEVFGEQGRHARSAVGMGSLPGNITVEIEAIFQVGPLPTEPAE